MFSVRVIFFVLFVFQTIFRPAIPVAARFCWVRFFLFYFLLPRAAAKIWWVNFWKLLATHFSARCYTSSWRSTYVVIVDAKSSVVIIIIVCVHRRFKNYFFFSVTVDVGTLLLNRRFHKTVHDICIIINSTTGGRRQICRYIDRARSPARFGAHGSVGRYTPLSRESSKGHTFTRFTRPIHVFGFFHRERSLPVSNL